MREKETTALLDPYEIPVEEATVRPSRPPAKAPVADGSDEIDWDNVFKGLIEIPFDIPRD
jgi:hypothetical protein